jgi:hypothetical protein
MVQLWNQLATDPNDLISTVTFLTATPGISFGFDPTYDNQFGFSGDADFGGLSTNGVNGAFVAADGATSS